MTTETNRLPEAPDTIRWRELVAVTALLLLLAVTFTWPLTRHFSTDVLYTHHAAPGYERVPIAHGDHLQLLYFFWLFGDSVREGRAPLTDHYEFRDGTPPGFFFQPSLLPVLTLLLSPLGLVASYNLLTLFSFVGAGLATHLLLRLEVPDAWAAFAGALVVALFPYRVAQLAGHANGFLSFLIPLYLYFLERSLRGSRWRLAAVAAGVTFFLAGAMEFHIVYYLGILLGLYLPVRLFAPLAEWLEPRTQHRDPAGLLSPLLAASGGAGAGVAAYHIADRMHDLARPAGWLATAAFGAVMGLLSWQVLRGAAARYLPAPPAGWSRVCARPLAALALLGLAPLGARLGIPYLGRAAAVAALIAAVVLALPLLRRVAAARPKPGAGELLRGRSARLLLHAGFIGATFGYLLVVRRLVFSSSVAGGGRRFSEVSSFSPRPQDLFTAVGADGERAVYLGLVAAALALVGLMAHRRIVDPGRRGRIAFFGGVGVAGVLLAVGPNLDLVPVYHLLFRTVPMFNFPRVSGRILMVASVGLAMLAAVGFAALRLRAGRRAGLFSVAALALLAADYLPRTEPGLTTLPATHPVYEQLARERAPGETILELPIWPGDTAWSSIYLWYVTRYRNLLLNGYSPATPRAYVERVFKPLYPLDFGEMRRPQYDLLRSLGIRHVLFHEEAYPRKISDFPFRLAVENLRASPYLETVAYAPPVWLFRLRPDPPPSEAVIAGSSPVGSLWEAEDAGGGQGTRSADPLASGGQVLSIPAGAAGTLNRPFPARTYPAGSYRAQARFLAGSPGKSPGLSLDVKLEGPERTIASAGAAPGSDGVGVIDLEAGFTLRAPARVFLEVRSDGSAPVVWDYALLRFSDAEEPQLAIEVEELWHMGTPVAEPDASAGQAVELVPGYHPRDYAFSGPDRVLPAGDWIARLRYRGAAATLGEERFEAGLANVATALAAVALPGSNGSGEYQEATLRFRLERSAPVRFRVYFPGKRRLSLDSITIEPGS